MTSARLLVQSFIGRDVSFTLTCLSVAVNRRPVSIDVHGLDVDRVGSIGDQVVKERVVDIPRNQNLFRKEPHESQKSAYVLFSRTTVKMYLTTSHLKRVGVSFLLLKFCPNTN